MNESIKTSLKTLPPKAKQIFKKTKTWCSDQYHILFKSAAINHLRIQNALKNPDGTYQVTLRFASYTDLKRYQRKMRRLTVSLSSAVAMVIVAVIVAPYVLNPNKSSAATFQWVQNKWTAVSGATTGHPTSTDFGNYASINASLTTVNNQPTLATPTLITAGDENFSGKATTNTYANASNSSALTLTSVINGTCANSDNSMCKQGAGLQCTQENQCKLNDGQNCQGQASNCASSYCKLSDTTCGKIATGQTCNESYPTDCASNNCVGGICVIPCDASTVCGTTCYYYGTAYTTASAGGRCWFTKSLNTTQNANGTAITRYCYNNVISTCGTQGGLYTLSNTIDICPSGWRIPNDDEFSGVSFGGASLGLSGIRQPSGTYAHFGSYGYYWSSSVGGLYGRYYQVPNWSPYNNTIDNAFSVRCVK